jgi:hypothetical protein
VVAGFFIFIVIIFISGVFERWITGTVRFPGSPVHYDQDQRSCPERPSEPEKYRGGFFRVAPVGQSILESIVTVARVWVFVLVFATRLRKSGDCCDKPEFRAEQDSIRRV